MHKFIFIILMVVLLIPIVFSDNDENLIQNQNNVQVITIQKQENPDLQAKIDDLKKNYGIIVAFEKVETMGDLTPDIFAKKRFLEFRLDKQGIPIYNLYLGFVNDKHTFIVGASSSCGLDNKKITGNIRARSLEEAVGNIIDSIASQMKDVMKDGMRCKPDGEAVGNCKSVYNEKEDSTKKKILFLGSGFSSEEEFKKFISDSVINSGFKKIQPIKKYTGDGKNGQLQFFYGNYNIELNYQKTGFADSATNKRIALEMMKCPNTFYIAVIDKNWETSHQDVKIGGYYSTGFSIQQPSPNSIVHEFGHHFDLNDEYISNMKMESFTPTNCQKDPKTWEKYYPNLKSDFEGCSKTDLYRSSQESIMTSRGNRFNIISCMYIVKEMESLTLDKSYDVCKKMYDSSELEENPPQKEEQKKCLEMIQINPGEEKNSIILEEDMYFCENGYVLGKDDFVLDCNGHKIKGKIGVKNSNGIILAVGKNIQIKNCNIVNFNAGISLQQNSQSNIITNADLTNNKAAITLWDTTKLNNINLIGTKEDYDYKIFNEGKVATDIDKLSQGDNYIAKFTFTNEN